MAGRSVRRVALTGGIATGKSYVRAKFEELGVPTIDASTSASAPAVIVLTRALLIPVSFRKKSFQ